MPSVRKSCQVVLSVGAYRQIKINFWKDDFIINLDSDDTLFYLYMLSNPNSTQCGIFELSVKQIASESKLHEEIILDQIKRFEGYGKIVYDEITKEFYVVNWMKHNKPDNPKCQRQIEKELPEIKSRRLMERWLADAEGIYTPRESFVKNLSEKSEEEIKEEERKKIIKINKKSEKEKQEKERKEKDEREKRQNLNFPDKPNTLTKESETDSNLEEEVQDKEPVNGAEQTSVVLIGKAIDTATDLPTAQVSIINYLNAIVGSKVLLDDTRCLAMIDNQLDKGYTVQDFYDVIDCKNLDWKETTSRNLLNPFHLFEANFELYLKQSKGPPGDKRDGSTFVNPKFREVN